MARRLGRDLPGDFQKMLDARLRHAFQLALSRPPDQGELAALRGYVERQADNFSTRPESMAGLLGREGEAVNGLTSPELAALTAAARVLFNTDNFITRE